MSTQSLSTGSGKNSATPPPTAGTVAVAKTGLSDGVSSSERRASVILVVIVIFLIIIYIFILFELYKAKRWMFSTYTPPPLPPGMFEPLGTITQLTPEQRQQQKAFITALFTAGG